MRPLPLLALAGCVEHRTVDVLPGVMTGDLVVAYLESDGRVTEVESFLAGGPARPLSVSRDDRLHAFAIEGGALEGESGRTFATDLLDELAIYTTDRPAEHGACGRCTGATFSPPQIVHPGDECGPPPFARHSGDPALASDIRIGVRGGPCCPTYDPSPREQVAIAPLGEGDDLWPHDAAALAGESIGLFGQHHSVLINPTGRVVLEGSASPFTGFVISAEGVGSSFFVVSRRDMSGSSLFRIDTAGSVDPIDPGILPMRARAFPNNRLVILGEDTRASAVALLCTLDRPDDLCRPLTAAGLPFLDRSMVDALILDDGTLVMAALTGFVLIESLPLDPSMVGSVQESSRAESEARGTIGGLDWRAFRPAIIAENGSSVPFPPGHIRAIGTAGSLLLACLQDVESLIVGASIDRTTLTSTAPAFQVLHRGAYCRSITPDLEDPSKARVVFADGATARIDSTGAVDDAPYALPGLDGPAQWISTSTEGTIAWRGPAGPSRVFVLDEELREFRLAYGDPNVKGSVVRELLSSGERVVAVHAEGQIDLIDEAQVERVMIDGLEVVDTAALDSSTPELDLVVAGGDTAGPWVRRVSLQDRTVERIDVTLGDSASRMVEVAPGAFVLALHDNRLLRLRDGQIAEIPIEWDDPSTATREDQPTMSRSCWVSLSAKNGRAFASGCAGVVVEFDALTSRPHAQRITMVRDSQTTLVSSDDPPRLASLAICSDDLLIGARGVRSEELERGRFFELGPIEGPCEDPFLGRCLEESDRTTSRSSFFTGTPGELAGGPTEVIALFNSGTYPGGTVERLFTPGPVQFPETLTRAVPAPWGGFVAASAFGHLIAIR